MIQKKYFIAGFLGMACFIVIFFSAAPSISSLFFEYGTLNKTTFLIEDTTGRIKSSDRSNTSSFKMEDDDNAVFRLSFFGTKRIDVSADTYVFDGNPGINFGNANEMVGKDDNKNIYVRFSNFSIFETTNLSSISIISASVFVFSTTEANTRFHRIYSNVSWNETNMTWNDQPCGTGSIAEVPPDKCNASFFASYLETSTIGLGWVATDITSNLRGLFQENRTNFSILIKHAGGGTSPTTLRTKEFEQGTFKPYIIVEVEGASSGVIIKKTDESNVCGIFNNGNISCIGNLSMNRGNEWINPQHIIDVDDEDIEADLNTYVDIAGDNMTGPLFVDGRINASNFTINSGGNLTMYSADGTRWRCGPSNSGAWGCS